MRNTLSSGQTFITQYGCPVGWISMFGLGTLGLWLGIFHDKDGSLPPTVMRWIFLIAWLGGTTFIIWFARPLKRVQADEQSLYISNYFSEVTVPLAAVASFSEN